MSSFALFWAGVLACAIILYVTLDGYDLGVGVLFGTARDASRRAAMMDAIAPFWDGNETWLVVIGAVLFAAFPEGYSVFLGAFYFPVLLMLFGLILRGIAFEFRLRSQHRRRLWDRAFYAGSLLVGFTQGAAVGAMIRGVPVTGGQFAGGMFLWLHPFAILTGVGLVLCYVLLGASWLVLKLKGDLHDWALGRIPWLAAGLLAVLFIAFSFTFDFSILGRGHLYARPWAFIFPTIAALMLGCLAGNIGKHHDALPFAMTALFILSSFLTLGLMFWPYLVPYSVTVASAAAPDASLRFLFYGAGIVVLPIVIAYTIGEYWVFRGKIRKG